MDCYYKTGTIDAAHNQQIAAYIIIKNFRMNDFTRDLSVNESLRLFRALFFQESIPGTHQMKPIFNLYHDIIMQGIKDKLTVSTWLTVIETCRHGREGGLKDLLVLTKEYFDTNVMNKSIFLTGDVGSGLNQEADSQKRSNRPKRPKSVLLNKQSIE